MVIRARAVPRASLNVLTNLPPMTTARKLILTLLVILGLTVVLGIIFDLGYLIKGVKATYLQGHETAHIDDYPAFENREIEAAEVSQSWPLSREYNQISATPELIELNEKYQTIAFLIIKNDSLWFEKYAESYDTSSYTNSFSMAKTIVTALLGKAITDGYIESLEQPVADFFPHYDERLQVGDLASMASGLNWDESYYSPFSMTARAYFGNDIREQILNLKVVEEPGEKFEYLSGNTQLLGMVIEKAVGSSVSEYLSTQFWKPMGMESDGLWQLDSKESGMEKTFCCIASNARDFARFGRLYMDYGSWNGQQLLDSSFVARSIQPRFEDAPEYGYGLWLTQFANREIFYLRGILGQYVVVIPEDNLIVVRLGHRSEEQTDQEKHPSDLYVYLEEVFKMLDHTEGES